MKKILVYAGMMLLFTPIFSIPKLPTIPNISTSITLSEGVQESVRKSGAEAVKKLNIDWNKVLNRQY